MLRILPEPSIWKAVMCFDFDDTLVPKETDHELDMRFFEGVEWVRANYGTAWGIATGRSLPQLIEGFTDAKFPCLPDFVVVREREIFFPGQFGRWVAHDEWNRRCEKDHRRLFRRSRRVLAKVRDFVERETGGRWIETGGDEAAVVAQDGDEMDRVQGFLEGLKAHRDLGFERNSIYLRLSHRGYGKGAGLREAADRWGVGPERILAVGDNLNDLSMLQAEVCGACGCPANALPEVQDFVRGRGGVVAEKGGSRGVMEVMKYYFSP